MSNCRTETPLRRWRSWFTVAVLVCVWWSSPLQADPTAQTYEHAQQLSNSGKPRAAMQLLAVLLKKNPNHAPSRLLLGHLYYSQGQVGRAAKQFRRVAAELVPADLAYEYGITLYAVKDCAPALQGFSRVPEHAKESNLAKFYSGICALQTKDNGRALTLLRQATNLPAPLEPTRRQAMLALQQQGVQPAPEGRASSEPTTAGKPAPPAAKSPAAAAKSDSDAKAERSDRHDDKPDHDDKHDDKPPAGFKFGFFEPGFLTTYRTEILNNVLENSYETNTLAFDAVAKAYATYGFLSKNAAGRPYLSVTVDLREKWAKTTGEQITYTNVGGTYKPETSLAPVGSLRFIATELTPELDLPLISPEFLFYAGAALGMVLPDTNFSKLTTIFAPYVGGTHTGKATTARFRLTYRDFRLTTLPPAGGVLFYDYFFYQIDPFDQTAYQNSFAGQIILVEGWLARAWDSFTLGGYFQYQSLQPAAGNFMIGEGNHVYLDVSGAKKLPLGITATLTGRYAYLGDYSEGVPNPGSPTSGGSIQASGSGAYERLRGELTSAPLDWFYVYLRYDYAVYQFSGVSPSLVVAFQEAAPHSVNNYGIQIGFKKQF